MKSRFRNIFLVFGIVAVVIMLFTFDVSYEELLNNLKRAGIYLPLVLLLWLVIYAINALSWYIIVRSGGKVSSLTFSKLYKFTVSGFAINYVTPVGLMGGEPYRIMELTPYVGVERATSSVILYVMMHIFLAFLFMVERCRNLCGVLSRQLGNGDCTGTGNGFLFVVEYSVCEGIPSWDGSGLCPFGK